MKNINISNIPQSEEIQAFVQFKIMEWTAEKALNSLENPVDIVEARVKLAEIISSNGKFKNYLPLTDDVLDRVLALAFHENKEINKALEIFIRRHTSHIAKAKIDAVMGLWNIANNPTYVPENKIDYPDEKIA